MIERDPVTGQVLTIHGLDPAVFSGLLNAAYLAAALLVIIGVVIYFNKSRSATGESFHLAKWLNDIEGNPLAMAIVLHGLFVALAIFGARIIGG